jgi:4-amino-4-deoxy-L-arabinose transferase-like glycosyltransferase
MLQLLIVSKIKSHVKMLKRITKIIIFVSIIVVAFMVRKQNYAEIPIPGQSVDEYSNSWVGLSLIEFGMPVGVSGLPVYENSIKKYINVDRFYQVVSTGSPLTINYPWMDHPPLLGLITGGYAYANGARVFEDTTALLIRRPIIIIGTFSVILLMVFCWINYGFLTSAIGGLIYATSPLVVLSSRMIQAENAIIPCLLLCMIFLSQYIKTRKDYWLILSSFAAGLATLFKLSGFVCHLFVFFSLLRMHKEINKRFIKDILFFLLLSVPITFLYVIFGFAYDWETFKNVVYTNYHRFYGIGPDLFMQLVRNQRLTHHKYLLESWVVGSWLAFIGWSFKKHNQIYDILPIFAVVAYLIIYTIFGSQPYGWYTFPFWPLLFIILARFFSLAFEKNTHYLPVFLISLLLLGENISRTTGLDDFQKYSEIWRIGIPGLLFLVVVQTILNIKTKYLPKLLLLVLWGFLLYTNLKYLSMIDIAFWWKNVS